MSCPCRAPDLLRLALALLLAAGPARADVAFDDSFGQPVGPAPQRVPPPAGFDVDYLIDYTEIAGAPATGTRGRRAGPNLFHSLERLDLEANERASFRAIGASGIDRVFARITSGQASSIAGVIRSEIPDADLFLINPKGVSFSGPGGINAQLDVLGSFAVTTADYIGFESGPDFPADPALGDVLNAADPSAFGFLGTELGTIRLGGGGTAEVPSGETLTIAGSRVEIGGGRSVVATSGVVQIAATGSDTAEVPVRLDEWTTRDLPPGSLGDIIVDSGAVLDGRGGAAGNGRIVLRGGRLEVDGGSLLAGGNGPPSELAIDVETTDGIQIDGGSQLQIGPLGVGGARLSSREIDIDGSGTFVGAQSVSQAVGSVDLDAESIRVSNQAQLQVISVAGNGAALSLRTQRLAVTGDGEVVSRAAGSANGGDIAIDATDIELESGGVVIALAEGDAAGGDIRVETIDLSLRDGGQITTRTEGTGDAGGISVEATGTIAIEGRGTRESGIFARAGRLDGSVIDGSGGVGGVQVTAQSITLDGLAQISSRTLTDEDAGDVDVVARDSISIRGGDATTPAGLFARSGETQGTAVFAGSGNGGDLSVSARQLALEGAAQISVSSFGDGETGTLDLRVGEGLTLVGSIAGTPEISARAEGGTLGRSHVVEAGAIELSGGGAITSSTFGRAPGGSIEIIADTLEVRGAENGGSAIFSESLGQGASPGAGGALTLDIEAGARIAEGGRISAESDGPGAAGSVLLEAGRVSIESGGSVSATAQQGGSAGSVRIVADRIDLDSGSITTEVNTGAAGGDIELVATDRILLTRGSLVSARSIGTQDAGEIRIEANRFRARSSEVTTEALGAAGGKIEIFAPDGIVLNASEVTTSVEGRSDAGDAGNVTLAGSRTPSLGPSESVILDRSQVLAEAVLGNGGNIFITGDVYLESGESLVSASSEEGIDGLEVIDAPDVDLLGALARLPEGFLDAAALLRQRCAARLAQAGSFVISDEDGVSVLPDGLLPAPMPLPVVSREREDRDEGASGSPRRSSLELSLEPCRAWLAPDRGDR